MTDDFDLYRRAVDGFDGRVHAISTDQWHEPTPCTEWDVRMLVNHVTVEQLWVPPLLGGSTVAEIGNRLDGDQLGGDPVATWETAARESLSAFGAPGALDRTVHLSSGERNARDYCREMTADALIHSWDLARGIGGDDALDAELVDVVYERTLPYAGSMYETGLFAPPVPVGADADAQTRLLAIFGRRA